MDQPALTQPSPLEIEGHPAYIVKNILNSRCHQGKLQYLIEWEGCRPEERYHSEPFGWGRALLGSTVTWIGFPSIHSSLQTWPHPTPLPTTHPHSRNHSHCTFNDKHLFSITDLSLCTFMSLLLFQSHCKVIAQFPLCSIIIHIQAL